MASSTYSIEFIKQLRVKLFQTLQAEYPQGLTLYETLNIVEKRLNILLEFGKLTEGKIPAVTELNTKNGL